MLSWFRAVRSASVVTFAAALVASTSPVFTERSRRVWATTKRFVSPVLACLIVGGVQGRAAEVSRIELLPLQTVTVTEEQFLTGSRDGRPVTIAVELRLPSTAAARVPAVVLLHGSGGANTRDDRWSRDLNDLGVATLLVDSFSGRGIVSTVADQSQLSELSGIIDAYRALELLAKHPRIDATRIGLLGGSRGGMSTLYASFKRFHRMYAPAGADFAVYMSFYPPCSRTISTTPTWWSDRFGSFTVRLTMLRRWRNASPT